MANEKTAKDTSILCDAYRFVFEDGKFALQLGQESDKGETTKPIAHLVLSPKAAQQFIYKLMVAALDYKKKFGEFEQLLVEYKSPKQKEVEE